MTAYVTCTVLGTSHFLFILSLSHHKTQTVDLHFFKGEETKEQSDYTRHHVKQLPNGTMVFEPSTMPASLPGRLTTPPG